MGETKTIFVPFGELKSDGKLFGNDGLVEARNVVPIYGNYISSPFWDNAGDEPSTEPYGLHTHFAGGSSWKAYLGSVTKLYEYDPAAWTATDKTRLVGGAYGAGGTGGEAGWQSTSFGDSIIMTDYVDDPQYLASPATANFEKLALSGGANPGMDPKAKFTYAMGQNLHLANLNLTGIFDGLPAGANPTVVCWSQSGNERQFGSFNATPELTGADYQDLAYDYGHIAGVAGSHRFAILFMQKGIVREDGPPFTFKPIVSGTSCRYPNSIIIYDQDVYFWGPSGPSVLRNGEGPVIVLGRGRIARTLIDNASTGFSPSYSISQAVTLRHVNVSVDSTNDLICWTFTSTAGTTASRIGDLTVIYNVGEDRLSFWDNLNTLGLEKPGIMFLKSAPDLGSAWAPVRDFVGVLRYDMTGTPHYQISRPVYSGLPSVASMQFTRGFIPFDQDKTQRVLSVRPILSNATGFEGAVLPTLTVSSKNRPYEQANVITSNSYNGKGEIVTPDSYFADFHQIGLSFAGANLETIVEMEGFEVTVQLGGKYAI